MISFRVKHLCSFLFAISHKFFIAVRLIYAVEASPIHMFALVVLFKCDRFALFATMCADFKEDRRYNRMEISSRNKCSRESDVELRHVHDDVVETNRDREISAAKSK